MSTIYNPESEIIAEIERQELAVRNILRKIEHAHSVQDKRVLNRQLSELRDQIHFLQQRLPH